MDHLLLCSACSHPAPGHNGSGCSNCRCVLTLELVVELGLDAAREEIRTQWKSHDARWASD